jgi:hypothetical protein
LKEVSFLNESDVKRLLQMLTLQKSRVLQILGVKDEVVVGYNEPVTTKEIRPSRLSRRVNNRAILYELLIQLALISTNAN